MQADAEQTTAPTAAEMATASVFTADGYSDADGVDHVTVAERALRRAGTPISIADARAQIAEIVAAAHSLDDEEESLGKAHVAADEAYFDIRKGRPSPPLPADLKVPVGPETIVKMVMVKTLANGRVVEHVIDCEPTTDLKTEADIKRHFADDAVAMAEKLGVWRAWQRRMRTSAEAKADVARQEAHDRWYAVYNRRAAIMDTVLSVETATPADLKAKIDTFIEIKGSAWDDCEVDRDLALEALREGVARMANAGAGIDSDALAAWSQALEAYEAAIAKMEAKDAEAKAASDAAEAAAPIPEALRLGPGRWYSREEHIERDVSRPTCGDPKLSVEDAAAKLAALRTFLPIYQAAQADHRVYELERELDEVAETRLVAAEALINTPAPDARSAAKKLTCLMAEWLGIDANVNDASAALTGTEPTPWAVVRVVQDILRLTGEVSPILDAKPFDAEGFIERFTAFPGHQIDESGTVRFLSPDAWPGQMGCGQYNDLFTVSGDRLKAYHAAVQSQPGFVLNPNWTAEDEARQAAYTSVILSADHIHLAYPDDPAKVEALKDIARQQAVIRRSAPPGQHLWTELKDWQKDAIRETAKRRARRASK